MGLSIVLRRGAFLRSCIRLSLALAFASLLAGCDPPRRDVGPVVVSAIGEAPRLRDPDRGPLDEPARLLLDATAQGLVRFDAGGQVEPALAERWIVIDNGMSYIFRLRDARWSDGSPVAAAQVVTALRRVVAPGSRNPLAPFLSAVDEIVEMTPEVIEVRLTRPRPDLLKLFAAPEMAIVRARSLGSGPFAVTGTRADATLLAPAVDPDRDSAASVAGPEHSVELRAEPAARAVARFVLRRSDLVSGGSFADWPIVTVAKVAPANVRIDPATGLFGLAVTRREGLLADAAGRQAVAEAIDRAAIAAAFGTAAADTILPEPLDSAAVVARPAWGLLTLEARRTAAAAQVARWRAANGGAAPTVRIALPDGPGATVLYGWVGAALLGVGIVPERVAMNAPAELRLIDRVAPYDSARWYLAAACVDCGAEAAERVEAARTASTPVERGLRIAEADAALTADAGFIPLLRPLRWSLVSIRLGQWQGNPRAVHPLNHLRNDSE